MMADLKTIDMLSKGGTPVISGVILFVLWNMSEKLLDMIGTHIELISKAIHGLEQNQTKILFVLEKLQ